MSLLPEDIAMQSNCSKDGSALPSLPDLSLERRKFRCHIPEETSSLPSARLPRDEPLPLKRSTKEEDICRHVYKRQAHSFFNELKEEFSKEAVALRKQALKVVAKSTAGFEIGSPDEIATAISELRDQVVTMQQVITALQRVGGGEEGATILGDGSHEQVMQERNVLKAWFYTVNERITRQQEEMKTITRYLKGEAASVKRIARGHIDQMQQEVMTTCLEEVGRLRKDLTDNLTENTMRPLLSKVLEKELAPRLHEVQAEISVARVGFSSEVLQLIEQVNSAITFGTILEQRIEDWEEKQRSGAWAQEQLNEEARSQNADLQIRCGGVEVRCDALDLRADTSQKTIESLELNFQRAQSDLSKEQEARETATEDLTRELGLLNKRTEVLLLQNDSHCIAQKQLLKQLTDAATTLEQNQQNVWAEFKSQAHEVQHKIERQLQELQTEVDNIQKKLAPPAVVDCESSNSIICESRGCSKDDICELREIDPKALMSFSAPER